MAKLFFSAFAILTELAPWVALAVAVFDRHWLIASAWYRDGGQAGD